MPPFYDNCPSECYIFGKDKKEKGYCEGCELKIAKDSFEESAKETLDERLGDKWKQYKFEKLLNQVYDAFDLKESKKDMSVTAELLVDILVSEQNRQRRIEDYNRRMKEKNQ